MAASPTAEAAERQTRLLWRSRGDAVEYRFTLRARNHVELSHHDERRDTVSSRRFGAGVDRSEVLDRIDDLDQTSRAHPFDAAVPDEPRQRRWIGSTAGLDDDRIEAESLLRQLGKRLVQAAE